MSQKDNSAKAAKIQAEGYQKAAQIQAAASDRAIAANQSNYNKSLAQIQAQEDYNRGQSQKNVDMYSGAVDMYGNALTQLNDVYSDPKSWLNKQYTFDQMEQDDPGYAFRQAEGNKALNASIAAGAGVNSGAAQKALLRYNQDYASNEFQNANARNQQSVANRYQALQSMLQQGQFGLAGTQSSRTMTNLGELQSGLGASYTNQLSSIINGSANTQAGLTLDSANAQASSVLNQGGNPWMGALSGAVSGAASGAAVGGWPGAIIGGVGGAAMGYSGASQKSTSSFGNSGGSLYNSLFNNTTNAQSKV